MLEQLTPTCLFSRVRTSRREEVIEEGRMKEGPLVAGRVEVLEREVRGM